jgi:hypothetical protein
MCQVSSAKLFHVMSRYFTGASSVFRFCLLGVKLTKLFEIKRRTKAERITSTLYSILCETFSNLNSNFEMLSVSLLTDSQIFLAPAPRGTKLLKTEIKSREKVTLLLFLLFDGLFRGIL